MHQIDALPSRYRRLTHDQLNTGFFASRRREGQPLRDSLRWGSRSRFNGFCQSRAVGGLAPSAQDGRAHFEEHGYVILPGFIAPEHYEEIIRTYESTLKPWTGSLPRYPTSAWEPAALYDGSRPDKDNGFMGAHRWSDPARVVHPNRRRPGRPERRRGARHLGLHGRPRGLDRDLLFRDQRQHNAAPRYRFPPLPAETIVVMWMALEDIAAGAGRLYLGRPPRPCADRSALVCDGRLLGYIAERGARTWHTGTHRRWSRRHRRLQRCAGLHGSLETRDGSLTRHSLTAHFGPTSARSYGLNSTRTERERRGKRTFSRRGAETRRLQGDFAPRLP